MTIPDWPSDQRPRERLILLGAGALSDAELLAIFLRVGVAGKTAVDLARDILHRFGSLEALFCAAFTEFSQMHGLGPAKYAQLQAVQELSRRAICEGLKSGIELSATGAVSQYLQLSFSGKTYESFVVLFLDVRNRLIAADELFRGTLTRANVYPREVVKAALGHNAAGVILAHNHPSGDPDPSAADVALTQTLKAALGLVDVRVLDHFVVAGTGCYSFAEHGYL
jgi:DNA repair protein RadC